MAEKTKVAKPVAREPRERDGVELLRDIEGKWFTIRKGSLGLVDRIEDGVYYVKWGMPRRFKGTQPISLMVPVVRGEIKSMPDPA